MENNFEGVQPLHRVWRLKNQPMTVRDRKREKQLLYDLGWIETENDEWICTKCKSNIQLVDCSRCGRCEWCYKEGCPG